MIAKINALNRKVIALYRKAYADLPREIWMLSAALFINRFGTMVLPFMAIYLKSEMNFGEGAVGGLFSVYGFGAIAGTYVAGRLTNRVGAIRLQIILLLLSAPTFMVIPFCRNWYSLATSLFFLSFFQRVCDQQTLLQLPSSHPHLSRPAHLRCSEWLSTWAYRSVRPSAVS